MAKQFDNLFPQITDFSNLHLAWRKAARGKRFQQAASAFEMNLEDNLICLQRQLQEQSWQPGGYRSFRIRDPKPRLVSAAPFADRVVHHALCHVLEPIYEPVFINDSYANRTGKGTHAALDRAQKFIRSYPFVLQCDIRQYMEQLYVAASASDKRSALAQADTLLKQLRFHLRLAHDLELFS
ncbi:MAG: hypothetical protein D3910_24970, partial [Candidatus Electrothrix sp. ATG2]|nr:hypothetical protein [Candidatus Electrothrix sp. ATG2]